MQYLPRHETSTPFPNCAAISRGFHRSDRHRRVLAGGEVMTPVNRWLPVDSWMSSARTGTGINVAMLVVASLTLVIGAVALVLANHEYLSDVLRVSEEADERRAIDKAIADQLRGSEKALADQLNEHQGQIFGLRNQLLGLQGQTDRIRERVDEERRLADEEKQLQRDAERDRHLADLLRQQKRLLEQLASRMSTNTPTVGELRVEVKQAPLRVYRLSVNRPLSDAERRSYRARFISGCGATAVVLDAGSGFLIFSEACADGTFEGPEFVVEVL